MKLTQIDILKYKSIKQKASIVLDNGRIVVLIGKNGSGKTNVLEAIKYALSKNRFYRNDKIECDIKYHIELDDDEIDNYFAHVQSTQKSKEIIVEFNGNNPEIRLINAPIIECDVSNFKERLESIQKNFSAAAQKYLRALRNIESSDSYFCDYLDVQVEEDNKGHIARLQKYQIDNIEDNIKRQIKDINQYIDHLFQEKNILLNQHEHYFSLHQQLWRIPFYKIPNDELIKISPIVANSLGITKSKLDKANEKLNNKLKDINHILEKEYQEMQMQLDEFERIKKEVADIFDEKSDVQYRQEEERANQFQSIVEKLKHVVFSNCYYIDNEHSLIFYNTNNREYRNELVSEQYLNSRNPIVEAFDIFLHKKGLLNSDVSFTQKDKLTEQQINKAIRVLNSEFLSGIVPSFDGATIEKFSVDYNNGALNLYVHEKNGDIVSFYNTSLGRRWYLTYQFVKALLKPGDMLFIDEPAAFLHPQAQAEFKNELDELAKSGVYLFYSTHSPYMIPDDWGQVFNVTISENGTQISKFSSSDDLCKTIKKELGVSKTVEILFNLEKTIILVEGVADKVCIEKFAQLLQRDLSGYYIHVCDGEAILQVAYICFTHKIVKIKVVLDNDNKFKNDQYKRRHSMYHDCIDIINRNSQCCVFLGKGEYGCLEDLFVEPSNAKYKHYKNLKGQWKVDIKGVEKLTSINDISEQTKNNFEHLFTQLGIPKLDEVDS